MVVILVLGLSTIAGALTLLHILREQHPRVVKADAFRLSPWAASEFVIVEGALDIGHVMKTVHVRTEGSEESRRTITEHRLLIPIRAPGANGETKGMFLLNILDPRPAPDAPLKLDSLAGQTSFKGFASVASATIRRDVRPLNLPPHCAIFSLVLADAPRDPTGYWIGVIATAFALALVSIGAMRAAGTAEVPNGQEDSGEPNRPFAQARAPVPYLRRLFGGISLLVIEGISGFAFGDDPEAAGWVFGGFGAFGAAMVLFALHGGTSVRVFTPAGIRFKNGLTGGQWVLEWGEITSYLHRSVRYGGLMKFLMWEHGAYNNEMFIFTTSGRKQYQVVTDLETGAKLIPKVSALLSVHLLPQHLRSLAVGETADFGKIRISPTEIQWKGWLFWNKTPFDELESVTLRPEKIALTRPGSTKPSAELSYQKYKNGFLIPDVLEQVVKKANPTCAVIREGLKPLAAVKIADEEAVG